MKKKILMSALLTIVLCVSLITGATFALFTDQAEVSVAITSGTVDVDAKITGLKTYSFDVEQAAGKFENGGTAALTDEDKVLELDLMSPGDKATLTVDVTNNSTINVKYRVVMAMSGELAPALKGSATIDGETYDVAGGVTAWVAVPAGTAIGDVAVSVEFPDAADNNDYMGKSADITVSIEAVQGNGETVHSVADLKAALKNGGEFKLNNDLTVNANDTLTVPSGVSAVLDLNGHTISGVSTKTSSNVIIIRNDGDLTVKNGTMELIHEGANMGFETYMTTVLYAYGNLTVDNMTIYNNGGNDMAFAVGTYGGADLTVTESELYSTYCAVRVCNYQTGADATVAVSDSKLISTGWLRAFWVQLNKGTVNVSGVLSEADATAANNEIFGSVRHDGMSASSLWVGGAPAANEAFVGSTTDLTDAIASGKSEIVLYRDLKFDDVAIAIAKDKNVTIELNGHDITGVGTSKSTSKLIEVANGATLTLTGNGTVSYVATNPDTEWGEGYAHPYPGYANNTITNRGNLVIDGVTIENKTGKGGASYAIDCYAGSSLTVKSGVIKQSGNDVAIRMFTGSATPATNVTIEGGEIIGYRAVWIHIAGSNSAVAPTANLTVTGGTLTSSDTVYNSAIYSYSFGNSFAGVNVNISGGVFNGHVAFGGGYKGDQENVTVTGGTFNGDLGRYLANDGWEDIAVA